MHSMAHRREIEDEAHAFCDFIQARASRDDLAKVLTVLGDSAPPDFDEIELCQLLASRHPDLMYGQGARLLWNLFRGVAAGLSIVALHKFLDSFLYTGHVSRPYLNHTMPFLSVVAMGDLMDRTQTKRDKEIAHAKRVINHLRKKSKSPSKRRSHRLRRQERQMNDSDDSD